MKRLVKLYLLTIVLMSANNNIYADSDATQANVDPTLTFFSSLSACLPGEYMEKNVLAATIGPQYLLQHVIGQERGACSATLSTPDDRTLQCEFSARDLSRLGEQHFLQGILMDSADSTNQDTVNAVTLWSKIKFNSCGFAS